MRLRAEIDRLRSDLEEVSLQLKEANLRQGKGDSKSFIKELLHYDDVSTPRQEEIARWVRLNFILKNPNPSS